MNKSRARAKKLCWMVAGGMSCLSGSVLLADTANPFHRILERNVFQLKTPPAAPETAPAQPELPKVVLTGVTTILQSKRALINVTGAARPGEQAQVQSMILSEGQRDGPIEVVAIDELKHGGTVKLMNHGVLQELTMDKDAPKLVAAAIPAPLSPGTGNGSVPALSPGVELRKLSNPQPQHPPATDPPNKSPRGTGITPTGRSVSQEEEQAIRMLVQHVESTDRGESMPPLPPPLTEVLDTPK